MYEAGIMEPKISIAQALADYFDVSIDYLVGRSDNPESHKP
jgi:transcriptional regulator with XRE-family HTH domain